jgi:midasin
MAIDGSFNLKLALETFSVRCPKVAAFPCFTSILSKGGEVVDNEEVIHALGDAFLHPEFTVPLVHCFLPIIRNVVDRVVGLLRLVDDLKSSIDYSDDVSSVLDNAMTEGISVIDFYVRRGQRLELHECACLAFSRALHFNTSLLGSILNYFEKAPPPYERILVKDIVSESRMEATDAYLLCLRVSYRFLVIRPEVFSKLWDWSCYLDSMKRLSECPRQQRHFLEKYRDAVWCGIQILSVVLRCSDRLAGCFGFEEEEALSCLLRWEEFCQDIEIEKAGLYIQLPTYTALKSLQQFNTLVPGINKRQSAGLEADEPQMKIRRLDTWLVIFVFLPIIFTIYPRCT